MSFNNCTREQWAHAKRSVSALNGDSFETLSTLNADSNYTSVDLVHYTKSNILLARKTIYLEMNLKTLEEILTEIRVLNRCQCENIVEFFAAYATTCEVSICMEYLDLGSLTDVIEHYGRLSELLIGWIGVSVLRGILYLKDNLRVLHRDIKPSNILINRLGQVKICDLGVSKLLIESKAVTFVGSGSYMAPERIKGGVYGSKSDVWSFGLILLEAAVGRYPIPPLTRLEYSARFNVPIEDLEEDIDPKSEEDLQWLQKNCDPKKMNQFDLLVYISDYELPKPPPSLFSVEFVELVGRCLTHCHDTRIEDTEISILPFITKHANVGCQNAFKSWCQSPTAIFRRI